MGYCKDYCEEKGISTSHLNEAQSLLYYIAENGRLARSISEDAYKLFQQGIRALEKDFTLDENSTLDEVRAEIMQLDYDTVDFGYDYNDISMTEEVHTVCREEVLQIIDKYRKESEV